MRLELSKVVLLLLAVTTLSAKSMNYRVNNIHTMTMPKGEISLNLSYMSMNDTIDILDIKESELGSTASNFDALGDLSGYEVRLMYGLSSDLMFSYELSRQTITYNNNNLENTKNEIFARYNLLQNPYGVLNNGISVDVGFINNRLGNHYISNINDINEVAKRYFSDDDFKIVPENGGLSAVHNNQSTSLRYYPWIGLEETSDNSIYLRVLTGFHTDSSMYDFFIGAKKSKINNIVTANSELLELAAINGYDIYKDLRRTETMFFAGTSISYEIRDYVLEFMYEFDYFQRESNLDYINTNHIVDLTLDYKITQNLVVYAGGRLMYRQLNGQIPYLYNEYTQTTYDHKYGYAKIGIIYNFK